MRKIYVIGSQKGGVGKTTSTLNLAYVLQKLGKKVLAVDFDSQANLTACYGIENTGEAGTMSINMRWWPRRRILISFRNNFLINA